MTEAYLGVLGVAEALGVSRHAVHKWRSRYPSDSAHPFPEPDVEVDGAPGWAAARLDDIVEWRENLPGRGTGGGRPTLARQTYLREAQARGITREEAEHLIVAFGEEFPEMTEPQLQEWLIGKWRGLDEIDALAERLRRD